MKYPEYKNQYFVLLDNAKLIRLGHQPDDETAREKADEVADLHRCDWLHVLDYTVAKQWSMQLHRAENEVTTLVASKYQRELDDAMGI